MFIMQVPAKLLTEFIHLTGIDSALFESAECLVLSNERTWNQYKLDLHGNLIFITTQILALYGDDGYNSSV